MYKLLSDNEEDMMIVYRNDADNLDHKKSNKLLKNSHTKGTIYVSLFNKYFGFHSKQR